MGLLAISLQKLTQFVRKYGVAAGKPRRSNFQLEGQLK